MTALYILLGVLAALFLISLLRVGVGVEYSQEGLNVQMRVGPVHIQVFPVKKTSKPPREKKPKKPKRDKKPEAPPKKEHPKGGMVDLVLALLPVVLDTVGRFTRKLQMDELELVLTIAASDPADTAVLYGQANALLGSLWHPLTQAFHVVDGHARVEVDFQSEHMTIYLRTALSLTIGQGVSIGVIFAGKALSTFLRVRREGKQRKAA